MEVLSFLMNVLNNIVDILFNAMTPFGVSIGAILFGAFVMFAAINLFTVFLGIFRGDIGLSSLGSSKDYSKKSFNYKKASRDLEYSTRSGLIDMLKKKEE